ncbi:uncharacterized protein LOC107367834 isoform X3 [Tetranychus urticae]|uniref:uncharacterized protein LOC107367834 isoform X3 n=1 Tax=Tetranychus urticae TaxID=32264 RepID=UPI00077B884C|nr:uncharacterized protein LOC107367834 isoform X3 [Tetranychus urticae]
MINLISIKICFHYILIMSSYCAPLIDHQPASSSRPDNIFLGKSNSTFLGFNTSTTTTTSILSLSNSNPIRLSDKLSSKCPNIPVNKLVKIDQNLTFVPEEVLIELSHIKSGKQLLDYLTDNDNQLHNQSLTTFAKSRRKVRSALEKSKPTWLDHFPGTCSPENRTQVIKSSQGKSEIYFPGCIKIPRCSGCCPSDRLTCQPTEVSNISVEVMVLRYIPHSRRFKYAGRQRFSFASHKQCSCECIQKESDCSSSQLYKKEECRCVCRDLSAAANCTSDPTKYWDSSECSCKCLHPHNCSSGLQFNEKTCSCEASLNGSLSHQPGSNDLIANNLNNLRAVSPSTTLWDSYSNGFNLLSGNVQGGEFNEMDKLHRSLGFQGINPSSVSLPLPPT